MRNKTKRFVERFKDTNLSRPIDEQIRKVRKQIADMLQSLIDEKIISSTMTIKDVIKFLK